MRPWSSSPPAVGPRSRGGPLRRVSLESLGSPPRSASGGVRTDPRLWTTMVGSWYRVEAHEERVPEQGLILYANHNGGLGRGLSGSTSRHCASSSYTPAHARPGPDPRGWLIGLPQEGQRRHEPGRAVRGHRRRARRRRGDLPRGRGRDRAPSALQRTATRTRCHRLRRLDLGLVPVAITYEAGRYRSVLRDVVNPFSWATSWGTTRRPRRGRPRRIRDRCARAPKHEGRTGSQPPGSRPTSPSRADRCRLACAPVAGMAGCAPLRGRAARN